MEQRVSVGRQAWIDAAYSAFQASGLRAVRIEVLARSLSATKGSFYWHFDNRATLIEAVVGRWEVEQTEQLIAFAEQGGAALERLTRLFEAVSAASEHRGGEATLYLDAESEGVSGAVQRVSRRRIEFVAGLLVDTGIDAAEATRRATIALATVLGLRHLALVDGSPLVAADRDGLTATALAMTTSPSHAGGSAG